MSSDARQHVSDLINGFWAAQVINAAAILQVPELLAEGPKTSDVLAREAGAHAPSLFRLLRALQTLGLVEAAGEGRYVLTEAGQLLRADAPGSVRGRALFTGDMLWKQFSDLAHVVRTGGRTQAVVTGPEGFAALAQDPPRLHAFQQAMAETSTKAARDAMKVYDFGRFDHVLDLGGGYGGVLSELLKAHPGQTGAVCDLGYLQDGAQAYLALAGVLDRSGFIAGDFFQAVPGGFDLYLMKFIIHDWDDNRARTILVNTRAAAGQGASLVLLEQVVPDALGQSREDQSVIRGDLTMMSVGGKERTAGEYGALLAESGWRLTGITSSESSFSVIEALPA